MQILSLIARGGFGRVEKVMLNDGTLAALKTFEPRPHADAGSVEKMRKRFAREVRTQRALLSASFLPVIAADLDCESPWFSMPLAERSLQTEIGEYQQTGEVPHQAFADLLNGLEELHALEMVHRDLKPQNVLLHDGVWKLADFGLILPPMGETTQLTSSGSAWGTEAYAPPEQVVGFHSCGPAADIYAFGCVLHDFFGTAGRVPYSRHTAPGPIGTIIEKCTEREANRRFKTIRALRGALLSTLAITPTIAVGNAAATWAAKLASPAPWAPDEVTDLARAITRLTSHSDLYAVYSALDEPAIEQLALHNFESWKIVALGMCEWAEGSFEWSFCDVVAGRLRKIFEVGDMELKACASTAAAELAHSHNRWHVMRSLLAMCGPSLDDNVAARITIEMQAREMQSKFQACADGVNVALDEAFHPTLVRALQSASTPDI
jgi:eukaryotic-like serine/threonine-protein kinase